MENYIYIILLIILVIYIIFILFLYLLSIKINKFELIILENFKEKNNYIPSIYDITKNILNKHDKIFNEILILRKKEFTENNFYSKLIQKINTNKQIHNQLDFIFTVCNKHQKLYKNFKFLYIKDKILEKGLLINNNLKIYKKIVKQFNFMITIKNITII
jgi:hypothetical protein